VPTNWIYTATPAAKGVTMNAYDWAHAWGNHGDDAALTEHGAYQAVAWVRRCVEVRCNALSAIPVKYYRGKGSTERQWEYADLMPYLLWMSEAALQTYGAAYWLKLVNQFGFEKGYRWLLPATMKPVYDRMKGLTGFERTVNGEKEPVSLDSVLYLWTPNIAAEVGPGEGWVSSILTESGIAKYMNQFASDFFARGAMPGTLLSVEGNPSRDELDRLEQWWRRFLSGVKRAWETVAVKATVKPVVVGYPTDQLAMPELLKAVREQIAVAAGVPQTMLEDAANYACLPGDQLVWTPNGPKPIADLQTGDQLWQVGQSGVVTNSVDAIIAQGLAPIYEIKTPHRTLRASDNHPVMCVSVIPGRGPYQPQEAHLVWKRADQIQRGDLLVSVEECPDRGRTDINGMALTEEFMELAGLYVGDGDGDERTGLRFAIPRGQLQDYYASVAERTLQPSSTVGQPGRGRNRSYGPVRTRKRHYIFVVGSKHAYQLFERLGFTGNARTKRVPAWVYGLALPLRLAFLRGYLDADGTVGKDGRLVFGSCNKALIHDVRALLVSCGIPVSNVTSDVGRIGNYGPIESHRFICGYPAYNRAVGSHDERYADRLAHDSNGSRDGRYVAGVTGSVWNLTLPAGLGLERVTSARFVGEEEVYDLCTSGAHTFVAEGIVVHNTAAEHHQAFYSETIVPEATLIEAALNQQVFAPQGLRVVLDWQSLDIFQQDEAERAQALGQMTAAGVPLDLAMEMLGMELPNQMTYDDLRARLEQEKEAGRAIAQQIASGQQRDDAEAQPDAGEQREELRRWQRKALKAFKAGQGAAVEFDSDVLAPADQAAIRARLDGAQNEEEVRGAFVPPFRPDRWGEGSPYP